ncbi:penicillin-binding protein 2 [Ectothiorhodospiraceae bacterium 2226]|nr:penicillin-binding protein 2 [Ectothiorhodospiraceae bacterium 2226]
MPRSPYAQLQDAGGEARLIGTRALIAAVLVVLALLGLIARLSFLQIVDHGHYTTLSHNNRVNILPVPPTRGLIYDRNGVVLAENLPSFSLELVIERVPDLEATLAELGELIEITEADLRRFRNLARARRPYEGVPVRTRLSEEETARFAINRHRFPGVDIEARLTRHYPLGALTAHVVGYVGHINAQELARIDRSAYRGTTHIGKVGIEHRYEQELLGQVGLQQVETNALGRILRVLERVDPVPGKDLHLNIDVRLQVAAERALDDRRGAVVAVDVHTGAVKALVSLPTYDPNLFVDGIDRETYNALMNSPGRPLFNRALRGQYPPGSTVKPFVGLGGIELGLNTASEGLHCRGWYTLPNDDRRYRDWRRQGHGHTDLDKAIVESCDIYYYDLAHRMGIDRLSDYMLSFGFGKHTGIDISGEARGLMPTRDWKRGARGQAWFPGETLIAGIGQGYMLSTPLQLATITATLANNGRRLRPQVVNSLYNRANGEMQTRLPEVTDTMTPRSAANWQQVQHSMMRAVHSPRATARSIANAEYRIAGKTGTAQVFGLAQDEEYDEENVAKHLRDHALFVAYAPAEEPRLAVSVIVENGGSGGAVAAPVARQVLDAYFLEAQP